MRRQYTLAWSLILIGALLLLNQTGLFNLTRTNMVILISLLIGGLLINKGVGHPKNSGILGGTFFILFGLIILSMQIGFLPVNERVGYGLIFISLAVANFVYFIVSNRAMSNLVFAIIFLVIGSPFLIVYYDLMPVWRISELFSTYWPLILILIGGAIIIDGFRRSKSSGVDLR